MRQQDKKQSGILGTLENGQKISLKRYSTCKRKVSHNLLTFMPSQMYIQMDFIGHKYIFIEK